MEGRNDSFGNESEKNILDRVICCFAVSSWQAFTAWGSVEKLEELQQGMEGRQAWHVLIL